MSAGFTTESKTNISGEHRLLAYRVERLEETVGEIRDAVQSIDKSLQLLSLVNAQHAQAREQISEIADRLRVIEQELPTLKLARQWVIASLIGMAGMLGYGVIALVIKP